MSSENPDILDRLDEFNHGTKYGTDPIMREAAEEINALRMELTNTQRIADTKVENIQRMYDKLVEKLWKVVDKLIAAEGEPNMDIVTGYHESAQHLVSNLPPRKAEYKKVKWHVAIEMLSSGKAKRGRALITTSQYSGGKLVASGESPEDWIVYDSGYLRYEYSSHRSNLPSKVDLHGGMMKNWEVELAR